MFLALQLSFRCQNIYIHSRTFALCSGFVRRCLWRASTCNTLHSFKSLCIVSFLFFLLRLFSFALYITARLVIIFCTFCAALSPPASRRWTLTSCVSWTLRPWEQQHLYHAATLDNVFYRRHVSLIAAFCHRKLVDFNTKPKCHERFVETTGQKPTFADCEFNFSETFLSSDWFLNLESQKGFKNRHPSTMLAYTTYTRSLPV